MRARVLAATGARANSGRGDGRTRAGVGALTRAAFSTSRPEGVLALQRTVGNRAVARMAKAQMASLRRQTDGATATSDVGDAVGGALESVAAGVADLVSEAGAGAVASRMPPARNPAGGCAVCSRPAEIGKLAHALVQGLAVAGAGSRMIPELMLVSGPEDPDPELGNGRLDLALSTGRGFGIEIGEIKPYNRRGLAAGRKDLDWYKDWVMRNRPGTEVAFMQGWPTDAPTQIAFVDPRSKGCPQVLEVIPATDRATPDGLFFYRCTPNAESVRGTMSGCECDQEPDAQHSPVIDAAKAAAITAAAAAAAKAATGIAEAAKGAPKGGALAPGQGMAPVVVPRFWTKSCWLHTMDPNCDETS